MHGSFGSDDYVTVSPRLFNYYILPPLYDTLNSNDDISMNKISSEFSDVILIHG